MRTCFRLLLILGFLSLAVSCTQEEDPIALAGHDSFLNATLYDSLSVKAYTLAADSMKTTFTGSSVNNLLGYYKDGVFGKVETSIYTQITLGSGSSLRLSSYQMDSAILSLVSTKYFPAASISNFHIQIYQLSEDLTKDKIYYSTSTAQYDPTPLFDGVVAYRPADSIKLNDKSTPPQIRIKLSNDFVQKFQGKDFASNADFVSFVKGFYIRVVSDSDQGTIAYINLASIYSGMTLYYAENGKTAYTHFPVNADAVRFANYKHDYTGTVIAPLQTNPKDSINGDNQLYLEPLAGTQLKVEFPNLLEWGKNKPYIINQAALVLPLSATSDTIPPKVLYYSLINNNGSLTAKDSAHYNAAKKEYRFYMNSDIQRMLTGKISNNGIVLKIYNGDREANRCVLNGPLSASRMRLEILYTEATE